ncbi:dTDP-4-dehydrorhamnose 3,5-epimerase [Loktanella sp. DJP18]|uniref:dTDP-4-dehydrorhamnose 3,5-epimerase n=1 Tax=Loktanella sp. DJP18 TaxID=3409788 RepID=UPI003BB6E7C9
MRTQTTSCPDLSARRGNRSGRPPKDGFAGHLRLWVGSTLGKQTKNVETTDLDGVLVLTPRIFSDARGSFQETYNREALADLGIHTTFVQDNQSWSRDQGTVRGLHYQSPPHAQTKLVRVLVGEIRDVAVDVRRNSRTFGQWISVTLSADNNRQLLIPAGFLHGFVTRAPDTVVAYKCSDTYAPACEGAIRFDDPDLGIDWGIAPRDAVLSDKDAAAGWFADFDTPFILEDTP